MKHILFIALFFLPAAFVFSDTTAPTPTKTDEVMTSCFTDRIPTNSGCGCQKPKPPEKPPQK